MLAALKPAALRLSKNVGLFAYAARSDWRRRHLLILCYHGLSHDDEHQWDPRLYMAQATFARRLAALRQYQCTVMPLGDAITGLYRGDLPERAVVITFDDGFFNFKQIALAALKRYAFPATVYLTTQRCDHNFPIARLLASYVLWKQRHVMLDGRAIAGLETGPYPLITESDRKRVLDRFLPTLASMRPSEKDSAVRVLASRVGMDYDELCAQRLLTLMNPAEIAEIAAAGFDIQLHTHRHRTAAQPDELTEELRINGERITRMTGVAPCHFCYPSGEWRPFYLTRLSELGIRSATTAVRALASPRSHPLLLPRVLDSEAVAHEEFEAWLTGAAAWMPQRPLA